MLNFLRRILTHNFFYVEPVKIFKLVPRTGKSVQNCTWLLKQNNLIQTLSSEIRKKNQFEISHKFNYEKNRSQISLEF